MKRYCHASCVLALLLALCACPRLAAQSWKWGTGSSCPGSVIESWPVATDRAGNVYQTGSVFSLGIPQDSIQCYFGAYTVGGAGGLAIVSTDSTGHYRWAISAASGSAQVGNIVTDTNNNLYLFGTYQTIGGPLALGAFTVSSVAPSVDFCAKISPDGHVLWLKNITADLTFSCMGGIDGAGNIYVAGGFVSPSITIGATTLGNAGAYLPDVFIAKLDTAGNPVWARGMGGDSTETITAFAVGPDGSMVLCGSYNSPHIRMGHDSLNFPAGGAIPYLFIAKYDAHGNALWAKPMRPQGLNYLNYAALDPWGNTYITGAYSQSISFGTASVPYTTHFVPFLAKYDANGSVNWAHGGGYGNYFEGWAVAPDACGNVWVAAGGSTSSSGDPLYLLRFDTSGTERDSVVLASGGDDQTDIAVDNKGNLYVSGDYMIDGFAIGGSTLSLTGGTQETSFLAKYAYPFCTINTALETETPPSTPAKIFLFPNPATDECTVKTNGPARIDRIEIYDITGRMVLAPPAAGSEATFSVSMLKAGFYTCKVHTGEGVFVEKMIVR